MKDQMLEQSKIPNPPSMSPEQAKEPGHLGLELGVLRRDLVQNPHSPPTRDAIQKTLAQMEIKELPHRLEFSEVLRDQFLQYFSLQDIFFPLIFLSLILSGLLLRLFAPRPPSSGLRRVLVVFIGLILPGFFAVLTLGVFKTLDLRTVRATIIVPKVEVRSGPDPQAPTLEILSEGFEVIHHDHHDQWAQVTYPGGVTGWVPVNALYFTQGLNNAIPGKGKERNKGL